MSILKYLVLGPVTAGLHDLVTSKDEKQVPEVVREDEIKRVSNLVEQGSRQGVSEIEIEISHGLANKFSTAAGAPVEGLPVNISYDIGKQQNGKYFMKVTYLPKTPMDKIRDLKQLHDEGVLTEEEFAQAKMELIKQL